MKWAGCAPEGLQTLEDTALGEVTNRDRVTPDNGGHQAVASQSLRRTLTKLSDDSLNFGRSPPQWAHDHRELGFAVESRRHIQAKRDFFAGLLEIVVPLLVSLGSRYLRWLPSKQRGECGHREGDLKQVRHVSHSLPPTRHIFARPLDCAANVYHGGIRAYTGP